MIRSETLFAVFSLKSRRELVVQVLDVSKRESLRVRTTLPRDIVVMEKLAESFARNFARRLRESRWKDLFRLYLAPLKNLNYSNFLVQSFPLAARSLRDISIRGEVTVCTSVIAFDREKLKITLRLGKEREKGASLPIQFAIHETLSSLTEETVSKRKKETLLWDERLLDRGKLDCAQRSQLYIPQINFQ